MLAENPAMPISNIVAILPIFDGFLPISSKLNYLYKCNRHWSPEMPKLTLCLPPARWGPRALDSWSVVAILLDVEIFLQISSKLDHLYRFSRNLTLPMVVLILCLPPAHWGHRALYSQCSGNIASFRWISSNLIKTRQFIQIQTSPDTYKTKINPLSPTCSLRTQGPRLPV